MGIFSRFERKMEDGFEGAADKMFDAPISPVQISKRAEKAMRREKMVGAGREYAPTLYTVLVNPQDDKRLFGYYPTLAGETETYLAAKATEYGLLMDGQPLVRFIVDNDLRHGKFDIIAEMVSAPIIEQLRAEEMRRYGIGGAKPANNYPQGVPQQGKPVPVNQQANDDAVDAEEVVGRHTSQPIDAEPVPVAAAKPVPVPVPVAEPEPETPKPKRELPYVPEEEIDRSLDYGEYTVNSQQFQDGRYDEPYEPRREERDFNQDQQARQSGPAVLVGVTQNVRHKLDYTIMGIGRGTDNSIVVNDINASRKHAELRYEDDGSWSIIDLNSTNGTQVNGRRIGSARLNPGDRITVGVTDFVFQYE
ncbi:MAG: DUF3662 and FHA domain-containing protein [Coriobacteriaceae bacterium]|nr:DUF3662 and FHA domain-containing protein [Coriobacteriaceae bacterium]